MSEFVKTGPAAGNLRNETAEDKNLSDKNTHRGGLLLSAQDVRIQFTLRGRKLTAVRGASLDVYAGETVAVVGESGSGKSVFTRAMIGMLERNGSVTGGKLLFEGEDMAGYTRESQWLKVRGKKIAMVFQDPMTSLNPVRTIGEQIAEVITWHFGKSHEEAKKETIRLLERVGIDNPEKRYRQYPGEFSGGMRQRVVIATAIACRPQILICDEPTTALDVTVQAQILELIRQLQKELDMAVIFITHDLGVVANIADWVAVMYAGQIVEYGTVHEIFRTPAHPYTLALLRSLPQLGVRGQDLYAIPGAPPNLYKEIKGDAFAPRNPEAMAVDFEAEPPILPVTQTHWAKSWLLHENAAGYRAELEKKHSALEQCPGGSREDGCGGKADRENQASEQGQRAGRPLSSGQGQPADRALSSGQGQPAGKTPASGQEGAAAFAYGSAEKLLEVKNLTVTFRLGREKFTAVDDVSFDIYRGETLSLVGESGSGKTTIGRAIMRIYKKCGGQIIYNGEPISGKLPKTRQKQLHMEMQMIFQDPMASLNERAKVDYIISEGLYNYHLYEDEKDRVARVEKIMQEVGLSGEFASRFPHEFSGGQRQRIGIARSLVLNPDFLVADEPISALDMSVRAQVINLLNHMKKERNLTYLFIAHDLSVVRFISDRVAVINKGKLVELAPCDELFANPLHPYTRALLSAIPYPDPDRRLSGELARYDAGCHDYSVDKPVWAEVIPGHYVLGNKKELASYRESSGRQ